jgi:hypothetical protein
LGDHQLFLRGAMKVECGRPKPAGRLWLMARPRKAPDGVMMVIVVQFSTLHCAEPPGRLPLGLVGFPRPYGWMLAELTMDLRGPAWTFVDLHGGVVVQRSASNQRPQSAASRPAAVRGRPLHRVKGAGGWLFWLFCSQWQWLFKINSCSAASPASGNGAFGSS